MEDLYPKIKRKKQNVSPKELIKLLEAYGFVYKNTEGDHVFYKREGFRRFSVPISQNPLAIHIVQEALAMIDKIRE